MPEAPILESAPAKASAVQTPKPDAVTEALPADLLSLSQEQISLTVAAAEAEVRRLETLLDLMEANAEALVQANAELVTGTQDLLILAMDQAQVRLDRLSSHVEVLAGAGGFGDWAVAQNAFLRSQFEQWQMDTADLVRRTFALVETVGAPLLEQGDRSLRFAEQVVSDRLKVA